MDEKESKESADRYQSLDLLRSISMWFVICIHYVGWGGIASAQNVPLINFAVSGGIAVACNCAVNCFFLISGFFISENENTQRAKKRILKVWIPTLIYSVLIPVLLCVFGIIQLNPKQIILLFLPTVGNQYWFSTVFIAITALLPFIAKALISADNKGIIWLLVVLIFFDSIQPLGVNAFSNIGYSILHAVTMLCLGYAIKRFSFRLKSIYSAGIFVLCVGLIGLITILSIKFTGDRNRTIADYNSILMIIQSVAFFLFFLNLKIKITWFSKLAPYVFGIYLLNDNQYARDFLWRKVLKTELFYTSPWMPLHLLGTTLGFFVIALGIEFVRINSWKLIKKDKTKWLI